MLVGKLLQAVKDHRGAPIRRLTSKTFSAFFNVAGTGELSSTIKQCIDMLKVKDDAATIHTKLAAMSILGAAASSLGRALSPFIQDITKELVKVRARLD